MTALLCLPFLVSSHPANPPEPPPAPFRGARGAQGPAVGRAQHGAVGRAGVRLADPHRMGPLITNSSSGNSSGDKKYKDTVGSSPLIEFSLLLLL